MPTESLPLWPPWHVDMKSKEESSLSHLFSQKEKKPERLCFLRGGTRLCDRGFLIDFGCPEGPAHTCRELVLELLPPRSNPCSPAEQNYLQICCEPHLELCKDQGTDSAYVKMGFLHNLEVLNLPSRQDGKGELSQSTSNPPSSLPGNPPHMHQHPEIFNRQT